MWVHVYGSDVDVIQVQLVPDGSLINEGVCASGLEVVPTLDQDGIVPIPGRDPLEMGRRSYWLTGTVSPRFPDAGDSAGSPGCDFLVTTANGMRMVGHLVQRFYATVQSGTRVTLECSLSLVPGSDWTVFDLPEEWSCDWRVVETRERRGSETMSGYVLNLEWAGG